MSKPARSIGYEKLVLTIILVVAVVIAILFVPMIPVKEAYSETEEYEREAKYEVTSVTFYPLLSSRVVVKNIDAYGGTFVVTHYLYDADVLQATKTTGEYLAAGQNKTFRAEFAEQGLLDVHSGYSVSAPTVIDRRVVAKHRTIYKSILELLIYR